MNAIAAILFSPNLVTRRAILTIVVGENYIGITGKMGLIIIIRFRVIMESVIRYSVPIVEFFFSINDALHWRVRHR